MNNKYKKKNKGFTLLELTIYVAIFVIILAFLIEFLWLIILGSIKENSYQEVQQNGRFVMMKMAREIKKATGINSPAADGVSGNLLSLQMADPALNPTVFDVSDGKLRIVQGANSPYYLTSDRVLIADLLFTNLSFDNTPGIIQIDTEISYINPANLKEYQASINLKESVSLLPGGATPSLQIKKPTSHADSTGWTTPARAYNYPDTPGDQSDSGSDSRMPDRDPAILFYNWAAKTETYTAALLKVNWNTNGSYSNDRFALRYTKDGGTSWQDIVPLDLHNETAIQTSTISLDNNQDLSLVQVKVVSDRVGSADPGTLYIYDIWTEGVF